MPKLALLLSTLFVLSACSYSTGYIPVNICLLAQCEQQADTGNGDLDEGDQEAEVDVGLE